MGVPEGVTLISLAEALAGQPEALRPHLDRLHAYAADDPVFIAMNAIVELENGVRLTCMVCEAPPDEVSAGTEVELVFRKLQNEPVWEVIQYGYKARVVSG